MKDEYIVTLVYAGDVEERLKACGTTCPFYVGPDGNTIQFVNVYRFPCASALTEAEFKQTIEDTLLPRARTNGTLLEWSWTRWDDVRFIDPQVCKPKRKRKNPTPTGANRRTAR